MSDAPELFSRPNASYDLSPGAVERILEDVANPLHRLAQTIPAGSKVLDIGAGNGLLARVLAATGEDVTIDGLEPNARAAELARPHYRRFHVGNVEDRLDEIATEAYDHLVLADVIEHVPDPLSLLRGLAAAGGERARILISTPNVAFGAVRLALLDGRFDYVDSGLLERTHLRFFTRATLTLLFRQAELEVEHEVLHQKHLLGSEISVQPSLRNLVELLALRRDELALTYQFFFVLRRAGQSAPVRVERYGPGTTVLDLIAWAARRRRPGGAVGQTVPSASSTDR